jgi:hypothetical protein
MTRLARIWQSWTLTRQLVVGMAAVVMVVLLTIGTLTVLTLRASVLGLTDAQLSASADGLSSAVTKYRITPTPSGDQPPPGAMKPLTQLIGQAPGNVLALIQNGKVVDSAFFADGRRGPHRPRPFRGLPNCHGQAQNRAPSNCPNSVSTGWSAVRANGARSWSRGHHGNRPGKP